MAIWRQGCAVAASTSFSEIPWARASTSARSRADTMSWSRSWGDRSFRKKRRDDEGHEGHEARDQNWLVPVLDAPGEVRGVWLATMLT